MLGALDQDDAEPKLDEGMRLVFICCSVLLVIMAGLMSGLTIGLMAMDDMEMEVRACARCGQLSNLFNSICFLNQCKELVHSLTILQ
jgi:hypothetical protein